LAHEINGSLVIGFCFIESMIEMNQWINFLCPLNETSGRFLPLGYLFSFLIETPICSSVCRRGIRSGAECSPESGLTACTYPIVVLVICRSLSPAPRAQFYLIIAETFAPVAECALFWLAYGEAEQFGKASMWRDFGADCHRQPRVILIAARFKCLRWFGLRVED